MTTPIATGQPLGPDPSDPAMSRRSLAVAMIAAGLVVTAPTAAQAQKTSHSGPRAAVLLELSYSQQLARFVRTVSDPASKRYRRYRAVERLVARFGPTPAARRSTLRWASAHGLRTEISPSGVFAKVTGDATALRSAFAAQRAHIASSELTVPSALRDDVRAAVVRRPASSRAKAAPRSPEPRLNPMSAAGASLAPGGPPSIAAALTRCGAAAVLPVERTS